MPARARNLTPPETYTIDQLPEILRSKLIAGIVISTLEHAAKSDDGATSFGPVADVLLATAEEIRDWHTPKPRPADLNGEH